MFWIFAAYDDQTADKPVDKPADPPVDEPLKFTVTQQAHINSLLASEKANSRKANQTAIEELQALKTRSDLNSSERLALETRIEEMQVAHLTKEELIKKDRNREKNALEKKLELASTNEAKWKDLYTESQIRQTIANAASANDAYDADQIYMILRPTTQLVEVLDDKGKPTGGLVPKVSYKDVNDDGDEVVLSLTIGETVKKMAETDRYFNLFKSKEPGGVGHRKRPGASGPAGANDILALAKKGDMKEYMAARKAGKI